MIYQFRCQVHGTFEVEQKMMADHTANCPECGKLAERVYSTFTHYFPDVLWYPDGRKQSPDELPSVPSGRTKWTNGWSPKGEDDG